MTPEEIEAITLKAHEGDAESQYQLGNTYARGASGPVNLTEAASWYKKAGERGHADALCNYAFLVHSGEGVDQDLDEAKRVFEAAAELGQTQAQLNLGILEAKADHPDLEKVQHWLKTAAENGNAEAAYNLGILFFEGKQLPQDPTRAFKYFVQAAEKGLAGAEYSVGYCFSKGFGTEKSSECAATFYQRAAEKGHPSAQYNLGLHFEYGEGVEKKDTEEALHWYQKAANQGHGKALEAIKLLENADD